MKKVPFSNRVCIALFSFLIVVNVSVAAQTPAEEKTASPIAIAIHGGAGTIDKAKFTPEKEAAYRAKLAEAVETGYSVLSSGGSSVEAVTAAINVLENSPFFNAGKGAVYTYDEAMKWMHRSCLAKIDKQVR